MNTHNSPMNKSTFPLDTLTQYEVAKGQHCGKTCGLYTSLPNHHIVVLFLDSMIVTI